MKVQELEERIINIQGLVNVNELRLFKVLIQLNGKKGVYTGLNENKDRNEVQVFSNKANKQYNLLEMLLRLKKCGQGRSLIFLYDHTKYQINNVYVNPIRYEFILKAY